MKSEKKKKKDSSLNPADQMEADEEGLLDDLDFRESRRQFLGQMTWRAARSRVADAQRAAIFALRR